MLIKVSSFFFILSLYLFSFEKIFAEFDQVPLKTPKRILIGTVNSELGVGGSWNVYAPDVLLENGLYKMWYGGQGQNGHDQIHYAESNNGINWNKIGVVLRTDNPSTINNGEDSNHVNDPSILKINGTYYMYYTDAWSLENDKISVATSTNGTTWHKRQVVIDRNQNAGSGHEWRNIKVGRPSVLYENGQFKMWFDSSCKVRLSPPGFCDPASTYPSTLSDRYIGFATSQDGLNWNVRQEPMKLTSGQWLAAGAVDIKKVGAIYALVHEGWPGTYLKTSTDGFVWTERGLLIAKSGGSDDSCGHLTPFIFINPNTKVASALFMGMAQTCEWNQNSVGIVRLAGTEFTQFGNTKPGDANHDGIINLDDYNIFLTDYRSNHLLRCDFNKNNTLDISDYNILVNNYGK